MDGGGGGGRPKSPLVGPASSAEGEKERARITKESLLLWMVRQDDIASVKQLLQEDPSLISAQGYDARTALHVAAFHNCCRTAHFLLDSGAPVNALDRWGNSPLADAESAGHEEMIQLLKEKRGHILGNHGSRLAPKFVAPPMPRECDWEIDPEEISFTKNSLIGKGSFGEVRKATWRGTPVAVKMIRSSLSEDKMIVHDFRHEVEMLIKLRHPNIVQFLGAVTRSKPLMLITEYLHLGDLHTCMKDRGPLRANLAIQFASSICRGMIYLHNGPNTIIHRDLKPGNILLVDSTMIKVGDFGLSKLIKSKYLDEVYKLTGETGSYRFMAPEVYEHKTYDTKVDVYSFAMILYEMLEGAPPFTGKGPHEAAAAAAKGARPKFNARTYPQGLKQLITRCWDGNPESRPEFAEILSILEQMETSSSPQ